MNPGEHPDLEIINDILQRGFSHLGKGFLWITQLVNEGQTLRVTVHVESGDALIVWDMSLEVHTLRTIIEYVSHEFTEQYQERLSRYKGLKSSQNRTWRYEQNGASGRWVAND